VGKDNEAIARANPERIFGIFGPANEVYLPDYAMHDFDGGYEEKYISAWHQRLRTVVDPYAPDQSSNLGIK
jgi:hypothetical protein